jgi:Serine protease inhibitor
MKKRILAVALCLSLLTVMLLPLSGCESAAALNASDLMEGVKANADAQSPSFDAGNPADAAAVSDFAVRLFQSNASGTDNKLLSPLSILCALAMTANGAKGETLTQMEQVLGLPVNELNQYLNAYLAGLPSNDKSKLSFANSVWFKDDKNLTVERSFLQANADWYGASVYKAPFDGSTLKDINNWVSDHTDKMIDGILNEIPDGAILYLINALAFDAEWENIYKEDQVHDSVFTTESGEQRNVQMMYCDENRYLEDGQATGFLKYYAGGDYAFVALLPNEGVSLTDYIASLSGSGLQTLLKNRQETKVHTAIPKFKTEYSLEMSDVLKTMGMTDAFDPDAADFTGVGTYTNANIFINRVIHKTYIAVDEHGTKAGAATAVEMAAGTAMPAEEKTVYLDRPFVYLLIDCEKGLPLFIGTMTDTGK